MFGVWVLEIRWKNDLEETSHVDHLDFSGREVVVAIIFKGTLDGLPVFWVQFMLEMRICAISLDVFQGARWSVLVVQVLESR